MEGLLIGLFCFTMIGLFHPIVIKAEYYFSSRVWPVFLLLGLSCIAGSVLVNQLILSSCLGITGFTSLWSIQEIKKQEQRVKKGWFPENPKRNKYDRKGDENMKNNKILPQIALGTWSWGVGAIGGDQVFGNHLGVEELEPVFDAAMKSGLNLWDSAVAYGMGASEEILGTFVKKYPRGDIIISTKFTPQIAGEETNPVAAMCEDSLNRYGTDYIDIYWIHNPSDVEKWTPCLIPLVKSGKVKQVGVSNHNLEQIKRAEEILSKEGVHISAVQNHYSLLYRSSEKAGILDYCAENKITFFAYMVLEQGALSGKYSTKTPLPADSQRGATYNPLLPKIEKLTAVLDETGKKYAASVSQIAMAWAVAKGTVPIIGVTKVSQVEEAAKAAEIKLTAQDINKIEAVAASTDVDTKGNWENPMI